MSKENDYKTFIEDEIQFYLREAGFDSREEQLFRLRVYDGKTHKIISHVVSSIP